MNLLPIILTIWITLHLMVGWGMTKLYYTSKFRTRESNIRGCIIEPLEIYKGLWFFLSMCLKSDEQIEEYLKEE